MRTMNRVMALAAAVVAATGVAVVPARADRLFVTCAFSLPKPASYQQEGNDFVGTRINARNCSTNLGVTSMTLGMDVIVSNQRPDGSWSAHTVHYTAIQDVRDGDAFTVTFPNDDQLIPLLPGGYTASATVSSTVPGYFQTQHIAAETFAWGVPFVPTR